MTDPNAQQMQPPYPFYGYEEEDEINLLDLFLVLVKHKLLIVGMVTLAGIVAVLYSLSLTNIYRSDATIAPRKNEESANPLAGLGGFGGLVAGQLGIGGGGDLQKMEVTLKSRELTTRVINKYELMPILFQDSWDEAKKEWSEDPAPTIQDAGKALMGLLDINLDRKKAIITIGIEHKDPATAKKIVNHYLNELSATLRSEVIADAGENMKFFKAQIEKTGDPLLKEKIYLLLAKEIERDTFARAQKYYSFVIIDPPIVPDLNKKVRPRRSIICILSVFIAFFLAVFLTFFIEFIQRIKKDDPERYQEIKDGLKIRRKKQLE